jgi:hypothetical protein
MEMSVCFVHKDDNKERLNEVFGRCNFLLPIRTRIQKQIKVGV